MTACSCATLPSFSLAETRRLENHVRRGGGVVFCLGDQVQPGEYNRLLYREGAGMLPASLVGVQKSNNAYQYQLSPLDQESERLPPMRAFRGENDKNTLLAPRFTRFFQTSPPTTGVKPRRVLSFSSALIPGKENEALKTQMPPGGPAILEWQPPAPQDPQAKREPQAGAATPPRLRGRVVLVTTTVNSDWNSWPASPSYPALMNELLYFASSGRLQEQSLEVGQPLEMYLPGTSAVEATVQMLLPTAGKRKSARKTLKKAASCALAIPMSAACTGSPSASIRASISLPSMCRP